VGAWLRNRPGSQQLVFGGGTRVTGADLRNTNVSGAKLRKLSGPDAAKNLDQIVHGDRALRD
jgi:hypothetical protein